MRKKLKAIDNSTNFARTPGMTVRVGRVCSISAGGQAFVDYPGNPGPPMPARVLDSAIGGGAHDFARNDVLLTFENGDARLPIIVGRVQNELVMAVRDTKPDPTTRKEQDTVTVEGKELRVSGRESVAITCGKSSIVLYADGRIVIKGANLVSRASESNKIKGAVVSLN